MPKEFEGNNTFTAIDLTLCDTVSPIGLWQFDIKLIDDGVTNKLSFVHKGNKVILKPLTLREVIEDQIKMQKKEKKKRKKEKRR
ncbi:hypothetical protein CR513_05233, partial [Mucuna pruriens]